MTTRKSQPRARQTPKSRQQLAAGRDRRAVLPVDAEDIAMARLQAELRETESRQTLRRKSTVRSSVKRTMVLLPTVLRERAAARAARDEATLSDVVQAALEHYLRSH